MSPRPLTMAAVVAALFLAGCVVPEEEPEADPLLGVCPYYEPSGWNGTVEIVLDDGMAPVSAVEIGPAQSAWWKAGSAIDRYRIQITAVSTEADANVSAAPVVQLRAFANETQRGIRDYSDPAGAASVPYLALTATDARLGTEYDVDLTSPLHGSPAAPSGLTLEGTLVGTGAATVLVDVTALYRVCGAPI